ncbi:MAG: glycoside hydrolase family 43 protein [Endozoicomonas sp.]
MLLNTSEINIRDPFILTENESGYYYMYGTTDKTCWRGPGVGFDCYRSRDLNEWEGPFPAFRRPEDFWGTQNFWAPEVHKYRGRYYMLATFKAKNRFRGTQILVADGPEGPFKPLSAEPATPNHWECLDGTLFIDDDDHPWLVYCHEWLQVHDGGMYAVRLSEDLTETVGNQICLFNASEAPWSRRCDQFMFWRRYPCYITDGPFLYRTSAGELLMLWSSNSEQGYAMGVARSRSGTIVGPWVQDEKPIWEKDGGHGMIFHDLNDHLQLTFHCPNTPKKERAAFFALEDTGDSIRLKR